MDEIDYDKPWYRIEGDGGIIAEANGDITDWIVTTETYKLAERLLEGVSFQSIADLRKIRGAYGSVCGDARALAICLKRLFDTTEWTAVTDEYIGNVLREHGNKYIGDEKHEPSDAPNPL